MNQSRTPASEDSRSLAISSCEGRPPAVTSDDSVNVQYDSLELLAVLMVVCQGKDCCIYGIYDVTL